MPTAEMQDDGTFMLTTNFLNKHSLPTKGGWIYDTIQYGIHVSFWGRIEIGYVCTLFNDHWKGAQTREGVWMINQDRHFIGRLMLIREGEFGAAWIPALVIGISDPVTSGGEYKPIDENETNGYFNRNFVVLTKHFGAEWGRLDVHVGYQYNHRKDYSINGPCAGVGWHPIWLNHRGLLDDLTLIAEYDARTVNIGFIASIWDNHFEAMFELQNFQWVNFGLRYKLRLKK